MSILHSAAEPVHTAEPHLRPDRPPTGIRSGAGASSPIFAGPHPSEQLMCSMHFPMFEYHIPGHASYFFTSAVRSISYTLPQNKALANKNPRRCAALRFCAFYAYAPGSVPLQKTPRSTAGLFPLQIALFRFAAALSRTNKLTAVYFWAIIFLIFICSRELPVPRKNGR